MDEKLFPDPELFVSEPDPQERKEQINMQLVQLSGTLVNFQMCLK